ncbi:hypothetical protein POM88_051206 [Heracleum sosnowskyi]|uniref:F-box associated domain-containing protein n=1 Tax=Heracleum sosnowskyi TaxID=360622 RepID=A0AAD8GYY5_9APIA|nr:hypothetical protein POM88_051206 [Heracleum sosnowskyi]
MSKQILPTLSQFWTKVKHSVYGFSFDLVAFDYCVIEISWYTPTRKPQCFVSRSFLKENRWDLAMPTTYNFDVPHQTFGLLFNNALYWIASDVDESYVITVYVVSNREFTVVPSPRKVNVFEDGAYKLFSELEIIHGSLGVITGDFWAGVQLWVMKEYGVSESWIQLPILLDYMDVDFVPVNCPENWLIVVEYSGKFKLLILDGKEGIGYNLNVSGLLKKYRIGASYNLNVSGLLKKYRIGVTWIENFTKV